MIVPSEALERSLFPEADVCIIGAGAAGITLACELDGSGRSVLLVDAGAPGGSERSVTQDPYRGSADEPHLPPHYFRRRGFGGTTRIWGGFCVPFDPIDFEPREHIAQSGWPVDYEEIARWYPRALAYCDAGAFEYTNACIASGAGLPILPGLERSRALRADLIERYSLPLDFGKRYRRRLAMSRDVRVVAHAHALRLEKDSGAGRIRALQVATRDGRMATLRARTFVVALGGIETTRLLFVSDGEGKGLGNQADVLGRYYMCHLENLLGCVRPSGRPIFGFERTRDGIYCRRKIQVRAAAQREHRLLNIAFRLHYPDVAQPSHQSAVLSAVYLAKRALIPEYRRILLHGNEGAISPGVLAAHLRNVAMDLPSLAQFSAAWLARRVLATRKLPYLVVAARDGRFPLAFMAEQTPLWESRIRLSRERDAHGVPRIHVEWRKSAEDVAALCRAYRLLGAELEASGSGALELEGPLEELAAASTPVGGHHIGTTRMSRSPGEGVVDPHCAVHGLPNLYVCSSSVFPTCSHANPTLTIVALAARLAARLRAQDYRPADEALPKSSLKSAAESGKCVSPLSCESKSCATTSQ